MMKRTNERSLLAQRMTLLSVEGIIDKRTSHLEFLAGDKIADYEIGY